MMFLHRACCCAENFIASGLASVYQLSPVTTPIVEHYHSGVMHNVNWPSGYTNVIPLDFVVDSSGAIHCRTTNGRYGHLPVSDFADDPEEWQDVADIGDLAESSATRMGCANLVPMFAYVKTNTVGSVVFPELRLHYKLFESAWAYLTPVLPTVASPFLWETKTVTTDNRTNDGMGHYTGNYIREDWAYTITKVSQQMAGDKYHFVITAKLTYAKTTDVYTGGAYASSILYDKRATYGGFLYTVEDTSDYSVETLYDWETKTGTTSTMPTWSPNPYAISGTPYVDNAGKLWLFENYTSSQSRKTAGIYTSIRDVATWYTYSASKSGTLSEHPDGTMYVHTTDGGYTWKTFKWNASTHAWDAHGITGLPEDGYGTTSGYQTGSWLNLLRFDEAGNWMIFRTIGSYESYQYKLFAQIATAGGNTQIGAANNNINAAYYGYRYQR